MDFLFYIYYDGIRGKHEKVVIYAVNQRISNVWELRELLCGGVIEKIQEWKGHVYESGKWNKEQNEKSGERQHGKYDEKHNDR